MIIDDCRKNFPKRIVVVVADGVLDLFNCVTCKVEKYHALHVLYAILVLSVFNVASAILLFINVGQRFSIFERKAEPAYIFDYEGGSRKVYIEQVPLI